MKISKVTLITTFTVFMSACSLKSGYDSTNSTALVKKNAELALQDCGKGNVKEVSTKGYKCR